MASRYGLLALGVAAGALAAAPIATAGPSKTHTPAPSPQPTELRQAERAASAAPRLLVTFADRPKRAEAERRLGGIGRPTPVVPEAGVWALTPAAPSSAPARARRATAVVAAEWSLPRQSDRRAIPRAPLELDPVIVPSDPLFTADRQWGLFEPGLWGFGLTGQSTRAPIAILDSGIDTTHEEWSGPDSPIVSPRSTVRGNSNARDWGRSGHGTHVAGIAAAPANGVGLVGVAPARGAAAPVIPVQIADRRGRSTDETMMSGIRWAVKRGAKVINISAGGPGFSQAFQDTVLWAANRGTLIVASVGNEGDDENPLNYPAGYSRVLGVGAQCDGEVTIDCPRPYGAANFSNRNGSVDVIAPGVNILSSLPNGIRDRATEPGYGLKDGTSMAAPYVAGVAALVQASNRNDLSVDQLRRHIVNTASDLAPRGRDNRSGGGVVNPTAAVTLQAPADDLDEVNDDIKYLTSHRRPRPGKPVVLEAFIDRTDDVEDVYAIVARRGERIRADLRHNRGQLDLYLWRPGTRTVSTDDDRNVRRNMLAFSGKPRKREVVSHRVARTGRHYVNVYARAGRGDYTLRITISRR